MKSRLLIAYILLLTIVRISSAEDVSISASVDRKTVQVGDMVTFTIHIQGTQSVSAPTLPAIEGFQVQYRGPSTQISIVNGRSSVSIAHNYSLIALKVGQFTIPSVVIRYAGVDYQTDAIVIQVAQRTGEQEGRGISPEDLKQHIQLGIATPRKTVYLNEEVPLRIQLLMRIGIPVENISYPTFPTDGFSVIPIKDYVQRDTVIQGVRYRTVRFDTTVYPITSGELTLGPAELSLDVLVERSRSRSPDPWLDSFFTQRARYPMTVKSDPYTITAKPLPAEGRPDSFSGGVGQYDFDVVANPTSLKVGDTIALTITVKGKGNLDVINMPKISGLDQFKTYEPQINTSKQGDVNEKIFEQVLIPKSDSVKAIPEIRFSYFDPEAERYVTKTKGPIPIEVMPSDEVESTQALAVTEGKPAKKEILGKDIIYIKDEMGVATRGDNDLYKNKGFLALQILPLLGFAGALIYQRRRRRFATDRTYARQYRAPRKAKKGLAHAQELAKSGQPQEFCSTIFKTMQEYLGDRFDLPFAGITIEIVDTLRARDVPEEILERLVTFFEACDMMRFAQSSAVENAARSLGEAEMNSILNTAIEIVRLLEGIK